MMFGQTVLVPCIIFSMFFFIFIQANEEDRPNSINIPIKEHRPRPYLSVNETTNTTQRTLIRVPRVNGKPVEDDVKIRPRRQLVEAIQTAGFVISVAKAIKNTEAGEEILGMAKTVAIVVIVISSLCAVCCLITIVVICVKCCCGNRSRKRQQAPTTIQVPQPIFVHSGPSPYHQQHQQHSGWNPMMMPSSPENRPMLPQPSAPPHPHEFMHTENPPPAYDKLYK